MSPQKIPSSPKSCPPLLEGSLARYGRLLTVANTTLITKQIDFSAANQAKAEQSPANIHNVRFYRHAKATYQSRYATCGVGGRLESTGDFKTSHHSTGKIPKRVAAVRRRKKPHLKLLSQSKITRRKQNLLPRAKTPQEMFSPPHNG